METVVTAVSFGLIIALILSPIAILIALRRFDVKRYKFLVYLTFGLIITSLITLTFGWWSDTGNEMLLDHYGYDFDAMNDTEKFANVSSENLERVKSLEISRMGIGWPIKVMMTLAMYSPYILIVYLVAYLIQKARDLTIRRGIT
ncbi:MAG TPA: hypothetical protein VGD40_03315 [Chryseosolibacter sp.]